MRNDGSAKLSRRASYLGRGKRAMEVPAAIEVPGILPEGVAQRCSRRLGDLGRQNWAASATESKRPGYKTPQPAAVRLT